MKRPRRRYIPGLSDDDDDDDDNNRDDDYIPESMDITGKVNERTMDGIGFDTGVTDLERCRRLANTQSSPLRFSFTESHQGSREKTSSMIKKRMAYFGIILH